MAHTLRSSAPLPPNLAHLLHHRQERREEATIEQGGTTMGLLGAMLRVGPPTLRTAAGPTLVAWALMTGSWWLVSGIGMRGLLGMAIGAVLLGWVLHRLRGGDQPVFAALGRVALSTGLISLVLGFFLLLAVMAGWIIVFGIMVSSGFEFETAGADPADFNAAFAVFLDQPAGQISQAVIWLALAVWGLAAVRSLPFATGTVLFGRAIVLEAFNWTRGRAVRMFPVLVLALLPGVFLAWLSGRASIDAPVAQIAIAAAGTVLAWLGLAIASQISFDDSHAGREQIRESH